MIPKGKIQKGKDQRNDRRPHDRSKPGRIEAFCNLREFHEY